MDIGNSLDLRDNNWKEFERKSKNSVKIIGNNKDSSLVKVVPKYYDLQVNKVDPTNEIDNMYNLLTVNFPEVKKGSKHRILFHQFLCGKTF